jgi:hypothetical protein
MLVNLNVGPFQFSSIPQNSKFLSLATASDGSDICVTGIPSNAARVDSDDPFS